MEGRGELSFSHRFVPRLWPSYSFSPFLGCLFCFTGMRLHRPGLGVQYYWAFHTYSSFLFLPIVASSERGVEQDLRHVSRKSRGQCMARIEGFLFRKYELSGGAWVWHGGGCMGQGLAKQKDEEVRRAVVAGHVRASSFPWFILGVFRLSH